MPILSVYALAGIKLLPAFQSIYTCIAKIRASTPAFESIQDDLINSKKTKSNYVKENNTFLVPKKASPSSSAVSKNEIDPLNLKSLFFKKFITAET